MNSTSTASQTRLQMKPLAISVSSVLCAAWLWAAPASVQASAEAASQQAHALPTLQSVVQAWLAKQPEQQTLTGLEALSAEYHSASSSWLANGVNLSVRHESDALTDDTGFQSWETGVSMPLDFGEQSNAYGQMSEQTEKESTAFRTLLNWQTSLHVRRVIWELKTAEVAWQRSQQNEGLVSALVEKVSELVNAGESPQMDLVLARQELAAAQQRTLQAQGQYQQWVDQYRYWSGFSQLPENMNEASDARMTGVEETSLAKFLERLAQHPLLLWESTQLEKRQAQKLLVQAQSKSRPELFVGAKSEEDDQTAARTSLMVEMSFPLGQPVAYRAQLAEQNQSVIEQRTQLKKTLQTLEVEATQAYQAWQQAQQLLVASQQQVELAQQSLEMAQKAYELGETNIQTLLQVQKQALQALMEVELQQVRVYQAYALLRQALGISLT
ncbi:TolC family protein [Thiomicrorhabdus sp. zzn3]|uniref:TolC family protein n=1 Tax=Thiomicrorhabdus sp. zzn3 TaxID=3039775 RepID=UPI002436A0D3|nr:TolC family protein [Thiomicrorhabdus sp. zzn3]MDG6777533.1 TolC family protein [Thiomicrorhabdus sp. zzn3]